MKQSVGYIRVSSKRQRDEGLSLENQEYRLRNAGCTIVLSDVESGRKADRDQLPENSAIYFVHDQKSVLYVGQTKNLRLRWLQHQKLFDLRYQLNCSYISWMPCILENLNEVEFYFWSKYKPVLNAKYFQCCIRHSIGKHHSRSTNVQT